MTVYRTPVLNSPACSRCGRQAACGCLGRRGPVVNATVDLKALAKVLGVKQAPGDDPVGFVSALTARVEQVLAALKSGGTMPDLGGGDDIGTTAADPVANALRDLQRWHRPSPAARDDSANLLPVFNNGEVVPQQQLPAARVRHGDDSANVLPTFETNWSSMASPALRRA